MVIDNILQLATDNGTVIINLKDIIQIEALSNYSKLYLTTTVVFKNGRIMKSKTIVVPKVLKWFDENLTESGFVRIHRNRLVNASLITGKTTNQVQLENKDWFSISRRKRSSMLR
jgi:two-component system, LytTR family, response regulator